MFEWRRHTQSVNNIRQINLGMQSLLAQNSDQIRTLPDGSKRQYRISTDQTLFTQLLPIVYPGRAQLTAESSTRDVANWLGPRVPTFISPADPLLVILDKPSSIFKYGITSYAVNQMVFDKLLLYPASITDGTSRRSPWANTTIIASRTKSTLITRGCLQRHLPTPVSEISGRRRARFSGR